MNRAHVTLCPGLAVLALVNLCIASSACGHQSPTAPAPGVTGISVTFPAGGTIYIGATAQFQAEETLSDGATRPVAAIWSSDTPAVAAVATTGVVTAVGAGEATLTAEANARRGTLRIRVYPNFSGTWSGVESAISCDDSGVFEGVCSDPDFYTSGDRFLHRSSYTQTDTVVSTTLDLGGGFTASGPGIVSVPGALELPRTRVRPEEGDIKLDIENLRFRSDVPARLTGTYAARFSASGVEGSVVVGCRLESVIRTVSAVATSHRQDNDDSDAIARRADSIRRKLALP